MLGRLNTSIALGTLPLFSHLAMRYGWKSISITVGLAAFAMVPVIAVFLKESPQDIAVMPYGAPADFVYASHKRKNAARETIETLRDAMKVKKFWLIAGSFFVCGLTTNGLIGTHFIPAAMDHGMAMEDRKSVV